MKSKLNLLVFAGVLAMLIGCASRLEPGGAYSPLPLTNSITGEVTGTAPDMAFYTVDAAYAASYATVNGLFEFERNNRLALWKISPNIKHTLDQVRPQAWEVNVQYHKARAAYKAVPVPANLTAMEQVLAKVNQLLSTANAVMPKGN